MGSGENYQFRHIFFRAFWTMLAQFTLWPNNLDKRDTWAVLH